MMERYQTELRNKNRGYMNLIVWQKAIEKRDDEDWIARISEDPSEYDPDPITLLLNYSVTPSLHASNHA